MLEPRVRQARASQGLRGPSHVVWRNSSGKKDWELKPFILDGDWTFVTRNSVDFRGSASHPGSKEQYADVAIHAGLICLNGPDGMDLDVQLELFEQALDELAVDDELIKQVLEVTLDGDEELHILRYRLPPENG
jgi:hypothetical protein